MKPSGPPRTAAIDPSSGSNLQIGIDVGGTWIKGASIDLSTGTPTGEVRRLPTPSDGTAGAVADVLKQLIDDLGCGRLGKTDLAVGIAIPSIVRHGSGPVGSKHGRQLDRIGCSRVLGRAARTAGLRGK